MKKRSIISRSFRGSRTEPTVEQLVRRLQETELRTQIETEITDYTEVIRLDPKDGKAYTNRSDAYLELYNYPGDDNDRADYWNGAIDDYTEAIRLDPDNQLLMFEAYQWRGSAYSNQGKIDEGIADFTQAILLYSDEAYILNNGYIYKQRGNSYRQKGDQFKAVMDFAKYEWLKLNVSMTYIVIGCVFVTLMFAVGLWQWFREKR